MKLSENSQFSFVNESILESFYFQPFFHIRCIIQIQTDFTTNSIKNLNMDLHQNLPTYKSNYVEITDNDEKLSQLVKNYKPCSKFGRESIFLNSNQNSNINETNSGSGTYYYRKSKIPSNMPYLSSFKLDKPFTAQADYISADYLTTNPSIESKYLNYISLKIDIPFIDGMIPLISTMPLHNYKHLLTDPTYSTNHICSNFINLRNEQFSVKYGYVKNITNSSSSSNKSVLEMYNEISRKYRNKKTLEFYSNLDNEGCNWRFRAYYAISELTSYCQAQIISDPDIRNFEADKSYLTIKIPLYVSYVYASSQASWSSIEYKSYVDATIIYRTASVLNDNQIIETDFPLDNLEEGSISSENKYKNNNQNEKLNKIININKNEHLSSLVVSKISMSPDGKFILEFSTIPSFYGNLFFNFIHKQIFYIFIVF